MSLETKKLSLIEEVIKIDNEEIIDALENFLHESKSEVLGNKMTPKTIDQLNTEINTAIEDEKNNRITDARELKRKVLEWS